MIDCFFEQMWRKYSLYILVRLGKGTINGSDIRIEFVFLKSQSNFSDNSVDLMVELNTEQ